jgi:hypothetical protein
MLSVFLNRTNMKTKTSNPWMAHVKKVSAQNKGKPLRQILKIAKGSYKK